MSNFNSFLMLVNNFAEKKNRTDDASKRSIPIGVSPET